MKRIFLFLNAILAGLSLIGQSENDKIVYDNLLLTDHVIEYTWDITKSEWILNNIIKYNYSYEDGEVQKITTLNYHTGMPSVQYINIYTSEKTLKESVIQNWVNGMWINSRKNLWFYNDEGLTNEAIIQLAEDDVWKNNVRYTDYKYENYILQQYTYQKWNNGQWVDSFYDIQYYDENGNRVLRLQIRINNTPINKFIYVYDENNHMQSYTVLSWVENTYVNNFRRLYEYNPCGRKSTEIYQLFKNGIWINSARQEYFYSLKTENKFPGQRIPVCHNGRTIYVSINAVDAHLAHGDCIGECLIEKGDQYISNTIDKPPFTIYPNPANEKITIKFDQEALIETKRIELTDFYGKLIKIYNIKDNADFTINRDNLLAGQYYIRLIGSKVYSQMVIFE